jgi:hypothetical protein
VVASTPRPIGDEIPIFARADHSGLLSSLEPPVEAKTVAGRMFLLEAITK